MRAMLAVLALAAALAACTPARQDLFVVLPNADGSSGAITVEAGSQSVLLDKPYAASEVRGGTAAPVTVAAPEVQQIFGTTIAARPIPPAHFVLYFISDSDRLTPASEIQYRNVFKDIARRPVYEVAVIGYTDTLGDKTYNQQLSLNRARAIRGRLVHDGLTVTGISIAGRGEFDLAVKTGDQVSEPRNRRVEITVR
jgi:outer membrane protein OmpA-like peptidoglycan-associated protein